VKPATLFCFAADLDPVAKVVDLERDALPPVLVWEWELTAALPIPVAAASSATVGCVVSAVREALPGGGERRVTTVRGVNRSQLLTPWRYWTDVHPAGYGEGVGALQP
jgi:hypothetical protein